MSKKTESDSEKNVKNKISQVLDSIKDLDTQEIADQIDPNNPLSGFSNLLSKISDDPKAAIGSAIGHWEIKALIGVGGMSIVYLVERVDKQLNQKAALKIIPTGLANKSMVDRFVRERQILSDLNHPHIAQLYDAGVTEQGLPWFVMEYIQGEDIISHAQNSQLNTEQRIYLIKQVCEALTHAHAHGIVHRDIKPNNLMVDADNNIKLLDFGIASDEEQQSLTMTGAVLGTPGYMSPEQAKGLTNEIDRRSDIFSLGVLLYKLIKHDMPFRADSISEISYKIIHEEPTLLGHEIPVELQAITFKCLEKEVNKRYTSVNRLHADLDAYLNGDVISARKITFMGRVAKKVKKHPLVSSFIVAAILSTILGISYGIYQSFESIKKLQVSEKYLAKTQDLKAKIRRAHMMPLHDMAPEYQQISDEIETLKTEIQRNEIDDSGLGSFALGEAYFNMKRFDKAHEFYVQAQNKGWQSKELLSGLGLTLLDKWNNDQESAKQISNKDKKAAFLLQSEKTHLTPALNFLKQAKKGASNVNYLAAQVAYGEKQYDQALAFAEKEIIANPWHYEALQLASDVLVKQFRAVGQSDGYDMAVSYLDLSNQKLDEAINIGRSDPENYISRCVNARVDVQAKKILARGEDVDRAFNTGEQVCFDALKLKPNSPTLWSNLSLMYRSKAVWHEPDEVLALKFYQQALDAAENGLLSHPDDVTLLSYKTRPLIALAEMAYKQGKDAETLYNKARETTKRAVTVNPEFRSAWKENGQFHINYANHLFENLTDLAAAEIEYKAAIKAFTNMNNLDPSIIGMVNIGVVEFYYYKLKIAQEKPEQAIAILEQSIQKRIDILPNRKLYRYHFMFLLKTQVFLIETKILQNKSIEVELLQAIEIFNQVCQFEGLTEKHMEQIDNQLKVYLDKQWLKAEDVSYCLKLQS